MSQYKKHQAFQVKFIEAIRQRGFFLPLLWRGLGGGRKNLLLLLPFLSLATAALSQDTTGKKRTIDITSSFKPVLREAVKINFNAASPVSDTSRPKLNYNIPQQNLLLGYLPAPLKPVALQIDTVNAWKYSNYIKLGVGNVHIPYVQAGFSFGDGKNSFFNAFAKGYTSKGKYNDFQKNNHTSVGLAGTVKTASNLEWTGNLGFKSEDYFFYGFQPQTLPFTKDYLRQRFQTFGGKLSLRNMQPTEYGLTYNPNIKVDVFGNNNFIGKGTETNTVLNLPLTKTFDDFAFTLGLTADLTHYKAPTSQIIDNNLYYVSPTVQYKHENFFLSAGVSPSWDNKRFHLLPNLMADIVTNDKSFTFQVGWIGHYDKGSMQRLTGLNPWMRSDSVGNLPDTRVQELYAGIKGSLLDHISYSAKLGAVQYRDLPLFVNDNGDGKTFLPLWSSSVQAIKMHGEIGWTQGEDLNWNNTFTLTNYTKVEGQPKAWGLTPLEITSSLRWQLFKDFFLKGDLYAFGGAPYRAISGNVYKDYKGQSGVDVSAGVEYKITKALNLWFQMNNLFNSKYQRWNQYEVYGFNVLGGIVFSFDTK